MVESRRGFLSLLGIGMIAAPAIVRSASLMKVRNFILPAQMSLVDLNSEALISLEQWRLEFRRGMFVEYVRQNLFVPYEDTLSPSLVKMLAGA